MLSVEVVEEIERLLAAGCLSQRGIARRIGVSRGSVNAIAQGKRPDHQARRLTERDSLVVPSGPPVRCATCGGLVQMPCLACRLRALRESLRRRAVSTLPTGFRRPGGPGRPTPDAPPREGGPVPRLSAERVSS